MLSVSAQFRSLHNTVASEDHKLPFVDESLLWPRVKLTYDSLLTVDKEWMNLMSNDSNTLIANDGGWQ